jgi:hypothetical protein
MTDKPLSFHDPVDTEKAAKYKNIVAKAKERQRARPANLEAVPSFEEIPALKNEPHDPQQRALSPKTVEGLEAMARANAEEPPPEAAPAKKEEEPPPEDEEQKLRKTIEARLKPLDIGQYLSTNELQQTVPIVPDKLAVTFRTVTDQEESYVDSKLAKEGEMTGRQFLRKSNDWGLAMHVVSLNDTRWPALFKGDGTINEDSLETRLKYVQKIPSPVINLLLQNLGWFLERVNKALTLEALGNG